MEQGDRSLARVHGDSDMEAGLEASSKVGG